MVSNFRVEACSLTWPIYQKAAAAGWLAKGPDQRGFTTWVCLSRLLTWPTRTVCLPLSPSLSLRLAVCLLLLAPVMDV